MSTTIDSKVVEMRFDNKNFESNVATTMSTLDRLKRALNLTGATKGLTDVASTADRANGPMSGLASAVETVRTRFSALEVMGVTALANITNAAVNAGKKIVSSLTIEPIKAGFQEYETQMNAVQTILANTKSKGTTLEDVNGALNELNTYADKTIYNFTEMTRNIGTFTAAGVDLDTSVSAIKGIANLAAVSGSTSQQASTAMYQLSQALASGTVKLMDWNSVVNAGMGGQVFQDALKETARLHGVAIDQMIKDEGSFRETLKNEWLTSDILTETLSKFTGDLSEAQLKKMGYTEKQIKEIMELGQMANDAATKVKTLTQLYDTLKEAAQSGWAQSWQIIVGDFEEAKALFTDISEILGNMIGSSAKSRNDVLQGWKDLGGRTVLIDSLRNAFDGIMSVVKPIGEAFREVFPPVTAKTLLTLTENLKKFTAGLKMSGETSDKVKSIFKGLFSIIDIVRKVVTTVTKALFGLSQSDGIKSLADIFLDTAVAIANFFTSVNENLDTGGLLGVLSTVASGISGLLKGITGGLSGLASALSSIGSWIISVVDKVWSVFKDAFTWLSDNLSAGDIFAGLAGGGIFAMTKEATTFFETLGGTIEKMFGSGGAITTLKENIVETLNAVSDALKAFTTGVKVWSIVGIAVAIALLTNSLEKLSKLNVSQTVKSLAAVGIMISMLMFSFKSMVKTLSKPEFGSKGVLKSALSLILVAKAIDILADAMTTVSKLSVPEIAKSLLAMGGAMLILSASLKIIGKSAVSPTNAVTILALAYSCTILADALQKFAQMSWSEIGRGLTSMGGALVELVATLAILGKVGGGSSIVGSLGLLIAVQGLGDLADALAKFGKLAWDEIRRGLTAMGGALAEVGVVTGALGKFTGLSGIFGAGAIWIVTQGLDDLAEALIKFGYMAWGDIGRGLTAMGGALAEVGVVTGALGKLAGFSGMLGSGTILLAVQGLGDLADALKKFGDMAWDEIGRGLTAMGGALTEVGVVTGALGKLAGWSGILGSGTILLAVQSLGDLADAFKKFGEMSWSEIGRGLAGMGGALVEVGVVTGVLGSVAGLPALLGSGAILLAVQGLGDIADALKKFGEMSWSEIGRGLSAMGGALGELALGGALNTFSLIGASSISKVAEPLGTLADSVKKWSGVTVPEALGWQLYSLASGIFAFTLDGKGASAIATVAGPLGVLADSVKKWSGVTVPDGLGDQLDKLSDGIFTFTFDGMAASVLAKMAEPLGALADSVKKWSSVTVPENIGEDLKAIADGIKAFSFAFAGGWSLHAIIGPLGNLSGAVLKWKDVTIPATLTNDLTGLAEGIKAFSFAFMGGWSISALIGPLGDLAGAISKWTNIKPPEGLKDSLKAIADGIAEFGLMDVASIQLIDDNLLTISNAFKNLSGVNVSGETLITFAKNVKTCVSELKGLDSSSITAASTTINTIAETMKKVNSTSVSNVAAFVAAANSLNKINISDIKVNTSNISAAIDAIKNVMSSISKTISSSKETMSTAMTTAMSGTPKAISSKQTDLTTTTKTLIDTLAKTIGDKKNTITNAFKTLVSGSTNAIRGYYDSFKSAGSYLVTGFANGISENSYRAAAKATAMAEAAVTAARAALAINSPSKVFRAIGAGVPEGFAQGIATMGSYVKSATRGMTDTAIDGTKRAISNVAGIISGDIDTQPTIRPVVDLSNVRAGAAAVSGMFGMTPSVGLLSNVGSISTMMNRRNQNGGNSDVIAALKDLKKSLENRPGDTYSFGDVTYGDDSAVSAAVLDLVSAIRRERRT